ncbi:MAG TPA: cadherin repeat domain-containing protein, partial [Bryobacteraceae bacterium]|nr:cadherin repeat domain-containing protein [Bryobacteraceae bacterium]
MKVNVSGVVLPPIVSINCSTNAGPQQMGAFYFLACEAKGGTASYQWSIRTGSLPNGFTMSPGPVGGVIVSGTPTENTSYYYVLQVADTSQPMPLTASVVFSGTPSSTVPSLTMTCIAPGALHANQNVALNQFYCTPSGGLGQYQYSISSGSLPPGLTMSGNSGIPLYLSGVPNTPGEFKFTIQAADSSVPPQTAQQNFDIVVSPALTLTCTLSDGPVRVGQSYTNTCTSSDGQPPYTLSTDSLPPGLSFAQNGPTTGIVSGMPAGPSGYFAFNVTVSDSSHTIASSSFSGRIDSSTDLPSLRMSCSPATLPTLEVGVPIAPVQCTVSGGTPPYNWPLSHGLLGLGLTIIGNAALLSGTPTTTGSFGGFYVTDSSTPQQQNAYWLPGGAYAAPRLSLTCNPASSPTSVGQVFSSSCSTSGGVPPLAWTTSGNLPPGLTYNASTFGVPAAGVRGSPTTPGPYTFTITLQDSASLPVSVSQTFSGTILPVGVGLFLECSSSTGSYTGGVAITPLTCKISGGVPPYQWSISNGSLPLGLSLTSVTAGAAVEGTPTVAGNYTYSLAVGDSSGQTAVWPVSVTVANPYEPVGQDPPVLSDLVFGDGWQSRIVLASLYTGGTASLRFYGSSGNPIGVPYQQVATGGNFTASFIDYKLPNNGVFFLDTVTDPSAPLTAGSAQLFGSSNGITGFGAFRYPSRNWEALVPIDGTRDNSYVVAFDNTGSAWTGVALASSSADPLTLAATVRDESGAVLETASIPMGPSAQTAITLSQKFSST